MAEMILHDEREQHSVHTTRTPSVVTLYENEVHGTWLLLAALRFRFVPTALQSSLPPCQAAETSLPSSHRTYDVLECEMTVDARRKWGAIGEFCAGPAAPGQLQSQLQP